MTTPLAAMTLEQIGEVLIDETFTEAALEGNGKPGINALLAELRRRDSLAKSNAERERRLRTAADKVPDPEEQGCCPNCGRMELLKIKILLPDGKEYPSCVWQHKDHCWYGALRAALAAYQEKTDG